MQTKQNPWHPRYDALAQRAKVLGWHGAGSLWSLCQWAGVSSRGCAGPRWRQGVEDAIAQVEQVVATRWEQRKLFRQCALGRRASVADAARAASARFARD